MKSARGFTLIEILIVMAIIAVLAALIVIAVNPAYRLAQARDAQRIADVKQIANALEAFYAKNGYYPIESSLSQQESETAGGCWNFGLYGWNGGSEKIKETYPAHQFLQALVDNGDLKRVSLETHPVITNNSEWSGDSDCGYQYISLSAPACGPGSKGYAIIWTWLETEVSEDYFLKKLPPEDVLQDLTDHGGGVCYVGFDYDSYAIYLPY